MDSAGEFWGQFVGGEHARKRHLLHAHLSRTHAHTHTHQGRILATGAADMTVHLYPLRSTPPQASEYTSPLGDENTSTQAPSGGDENKTVEKPIDQRSSNQDPSQTPKAKAIPLTPGVMEVTSETQRKDMTKVFCQYPKP